MTRIVISSQARKPLTELQFASKIKWRKVLNGMGYAEFDLPLTDLYATTQYINAGNYVHIFNDTANSSIYANADFGGLLLNDFDISPHKGTATIRAAGMAMLLQLSIVTATTTYNNLDTGTVIQNVVTQSDNWSKLNMTQYTVSNQGPIINSWVAEWGDAVWNDMTSLSKNYGGDVEVRPDWSWAYYNRQGVDNPNLVARYGNQGNVQVQTEMHLVNTELGNQIYIQSVSTTQIIFTANQTSIQFYGPKTLVIQDPNNQYLFLDGLTRAQIEAAKHAFPLQSLDHIIITDTPLLPFNQLHLGDRILFEAPGLPLLQQFNGLQRILAIEYDDTKRTMDLTLGNAVYTVLRGQLHQVRLY